MAEMLEGAGNSIRELLRRGGRNVRAANKRQLAMTAFLLVLGLLVARFSWELPIRIEGAHVRLPVISDAERSLYDVRAFINAPQVEQDERIQIVAYDDQTLIAARKRSPLDRGLLARALRNLDGMGAKAIGIDILFDQPQDEDDELVTTLRAMKTPVFVAYADISGNRDDIIYEQQAFLDSFIGRLAGSKVGAASIRIDYGDGVARSWPDHPPGLPPLMAMAMVGAGDPGLEKPFADYTGAIRFRRPALADMPVYSSLQIDLFAVPELAAMPELAAALPARIKDRYVLIGGEIVDVDRVETPFTATTGEAIPGIRVHAGKIAQMLDGARLPALSGWQLWTIAVLVVLAATLTSLMEARIVKALPLLILQFVAIIGLPFLLQARGFDTLGMPAVGWALGWVLAFIGVSSAARASGAVERQFAQSALGKYLPQDIAQEIIDHPERLSLSGSKRELYIVFSDLEGFTGLSHQLEPEVVARLLNEYLDRLSGVVLAHGGIIDKYVGDAVVAFWGAPIARPTDARNAALAGYAMWQAGEDFRASVDPSLPKIGKTRVGMHFGEAVVGNFGGERRIQYTALGDAMNTAARLESANKALGSSVMASRELAERSGLDWWRPMGKVILRGRTKPVEIWEPAPDFPAEERAILQQALDLAASDRARAIVLIEQLAARHESDTALQNLLERIRHLGEEGAYALG